MNATMGLQIAALTNIVGITLFSKGFTNANLARLFPELFGPWGWALIIVWGLAYLAVSRAYTAVPGLLLVFAVEKLVYVVSWLYWLVLRGAQLPEIWRTDVVTALFFCLYGVLDLGFGVFFFSLYRKSRCGCRAT